MPGATDPAEGMLRDLIAAGHQTGLAMAAAADDADLLPEPWRLTPGLRPGALPRSRGWPATARDLITALAAAR